MSLKKRFHAIEVARHEMETGRYKGMNHFHWLIVGFALPWIVAVIIYLIGK